MDKKNENNARSDRSKVENHCEQGQCQTKHDWDDGESDGDDKHRPQVACDDANDSQALTGGDITKYHCGEKTAKLILFHVQ